MKVAYELVIHAQTCGLQLYCKNVTKGDGSCYFHAVIDQLHRLFDRIGVCEEILSTEDPEASLWYSVCNTMLKSTHPYVILVRVRGEPN